jgi:hypothetical protein
MIDGFLTPVLRQCLPDIGLRNSKLPRDCGRLDPCFEGGTHCIQLASGQQTRAILGRRCGLALATDCSFARLGGRRSATLGLCGGGRKQRTDFLIIQPLQCPGQVLRRNSAAARPDRPIRLYRLEQPKARPSSLSVKPKIGLVLSQSAVGVACPTMAPVTHRGNTGRVRAVLMRPNSGLPAR